MSNFKKNQLSPRLQDFVQSENSEELQKSVICNLLGKRLYIFVLYFIRKKDVKFIRESKVSMFFSVNIFLLGLFQWDSVSVTSNIIHSKKEI